MVNKKSKTSNQKVLKTKAFDSIVPKSFSINVAVAMEIAKTNNKEILDFTEKNNFKIVLNIKINAILN